MRIVLCYPVESVHLDRIQSAWPDAEVVDAGQERIAEEILQADVFCGHAKVPVPWEEVVEQGRLRWIQSSAAGMDHCLVPSVIESEIVVTSASGVLAKQVADHTFALLTGVLRSLPVFFRAQQSREFIRRPTRDLYGARIGIIGLGGNGRLLAKLLKPMAAEILATDWFTDHKPEYVDELHPADAIDEILPRLDVLILTAPLNDFTRGMIDQRRLMMLPTEAVLINVARGQLIVESDLVDVLQSGHLWGVGLDVTAEEPLAKNSPLWELPNVIITPHVGGQRKSRIDDMTDFFCVNIARYLSDQPLLNLVDKRLGFPHPDAILTPD